MHEMGIANSVLEAVHQELHRYPQRRAAKVGVRIGELAGVDRESLQFCFEAVVKGTEFEPLDLEITWCRVEDGWRGDELELAYLELEDAHEAQEATVCSG
jgi:Zn finger protein HypA/HybF involved in hydrogenase expression